MWLRNNLANLLTLGNLLCGIVALLLGMRWVLAPAEPWLLYAAAAVAAGALLDALDGAVARALRADSPLGLQLDSLADVVTFGVAPALLLHHLLAGAGLGWVAALALALPLFSAWRLARFNVGVGASDASRFEGLPTPANGLYLCALALALHTDLQHWLRWPGLVAALLALQGFLLVSRVPFLSQKGGFTWRHIVVVSSVGAAVVQGWGAAPVVMATYLLVSLLPVQSKPPAA